MRVTTARSAGFCFGVKRAVDMVYEHAGNGNVYTYGPVIHNEEVVNDLTRRGVKVLETPEDIKKAPKGTVIIRAHGVPEKIYRIIEKSGHKLVDATCPFVLKIHQIVRKASAEGTHVIIVGDKTIPKYRESRAVQMIQPLLQTSQRLIFLWKMKPDTIKSYVLWHKRHIIQ